MMVLAREMDIPNLSKKLRYLSGSFSFFPPLPLFLHHPPKALLFLSKPFYSLNPPCSIFHPHRSHTSPASHHLHSWELLCSNRFKYGYPVPTIRLLRYRTLYRLFSGSSSNDSSSLMSLKFSAENSLFQKMDTVSSGESQATIRGIESHATKKHVSDVIEVIRRDESDLGLKLDSMNARISIASFCEIFRVLNCEKVSALRFFDWIKYSQPYLSRNPHICSLVIDNCGRLSDYKSMGCLFNEFKSNQVCLTEKAFLFLPVVNSSKASIMEAIKRLIELLNEVGGSCLDSGIRALIKMLCTLELFDIAKFVVEMKERKVTYYNILIKEMCGRSKFEEARHIIDEMKHLSCGPSVRTYNYLLSNLCKRNMNSEASSVLEEMKEKGCFPDAQTFEIFIYYSCRLGKINFAVNCFDQMVSSGIKPRLLTHAAFIKGYFYSRQYEEAYNYLVASSGKHRCSSNTIYSLLACLHRKQGNLVVAQNILVEMIDKGLKPNFPVYIKVLKHLRKSGRHNLARDLKIKTRVHSDCMEKGQL
ncbi:pentatricopeptide repeat-containing protein At3g04760, chloroplastic-like isoform X2 [Malania oleifera]|uniref:pentatricopeptide repeat-containing protein At3g04760, chloroplastic-like isoform X2 n=1 Tax=Malania oleifera TaxID=397392 RepID=UPI0025AEA26C|nr:pentatricopeptide repeat-containing protein At3g04760, chloroplastic-like isoform X2 [Malania oleifera]XP_057967829.1 pentatricopeptide repeat-containing protein At3g04760, chloroplastic-like isoform X2 [Malania oleifera]